jgi:hypothetical protein
MVVPPENLVGLSMPAALQGACQMVFMAKKRGFCRVPLAALGSGSPAVGDFHQ